MFDNNENKPRRARVRFVPAGETSRGERVERPRFHNNENADAPRPRFNAGAPDQRRPRFNAEATDQHRPRFNAEAPDQRRPRFNAEATDQRRPRFNGGRDHESVYAGYNGRSSYGRDNGEQQSGGHFGGNAGFGKRPFNKNNYSAKKRFEYAEKYEDPTKPIRLNKYLANAGICSRREADDFILAGVITVNGEVVSNLGAKVLPTDHVQFHDQPVKRERKVYILLNKPKNTVTTTDDPEERQTVLDIVRNACSERIYPVGRLDRNTTGVLLLTNDGDLAAKLTHPKFGKKKVYAAALDRELAPEDEQELRDGIILDDERVVPDALEFPKEGDRRHVGLEIHSGQNRVVRRMFEKVGYKVVTLDRVSFAGLTKKNVSRGKYRFLTPKEVQMLQMGAFE